MPAQYARDEAETTLLHATCTEREQEDTGCQFGDRRLRGSHRGKMHLAVSTGEKLAKEEVLSVQRVAE